MKIVDVSGFGHSGKTVVTDYLKQFDAVFGFPNQVEFELFRVPGGLLDLYYSIYKSWNLIRSTVRINDFKNLIQRIGTVQTSKQPITYFTASGHGYNQHFNNRFIEISNTYIANIITGEQVTFWPYENLRLNPLFVFYNKFKAKVFNSLTTANIHFSDSGAFLEHTQKYISALFAEAFQNNHTHVLLNNAFDPFDPLPCIEMIEDGYSIIVDRDPRDIFASQINSEDGFKPEFEKAKNIDKIKRQMTGFEDIEKFIYRYRTIKNNVKFVSNSKILRLRYEDFITNFDNQSSIVNSFIGLNNLKKIDHSNYDISKSAKNIGIWKNYPESVEIKRIHQELGEFCYQF